MKNSPSVIAYRPDLHISHTVAIYDINTQYIIYSHIIGQLVGLWLVTDIYVYQLKRTQWCP